MFKRRAAAAALMAAVAAGSAQAADRFAVGGHLGSTGIGVEGQFQVNDRLVARVGGDYGGYSRDFNSDRAAYSADARWSTFGAFLDLHPTASPLFVSAGVFAGERKADLKGVPTGNVLIGGVSYAAATLGEVRGTAKLSQASGFVGAGWDDTFYTERRWGVRALAGVAFSDDPEVNLTAISPYAGHPAVQAYLRDQERQVADEAEIAKTYPVLQLGLSYRF